MFVALVMVSIRCGNEKFKKESSSITVEPTVVLDADEAPAGVVLEEVIIGSFGAKFKSKTSSKSKVSLECDVRSRSH